MTTTDDDIPFYGYCERCCDKATRESGVPARWTHADHPDEKARLEAARRLVPPATRRYSPGCKCVYGTCWDEYLCEACAEGVADPGSIEVLGDDALEGGA